MFISCLSFLVIKVSGAAPVSRGRSRDWNTWSPGRRHYTRSTATLQWDSFVIERLLNTRI